MPSRNVWTIAQIVKIAIQGCWHLNYVRKRAGHIDNERNFEGNVQFNRKEKDAICISFKSMLTSNKIR